MLIAITGGIGAGKTTILSQFQHLGAKTLDADDVAHELYLPGTPAYVQIRERWGTTDRTAIAGIVFHNPQELAWLNSIMHPLIQQRIMDEARHDMLFCAIPLLFETGWQDLADIIIGVWCDRQTQMKRLLERGWSREHAEARLATQWSPDDKLHRADYAVVTNCSWQHLADQCRLVHQSIIQSIR